MCDCPDITPCESCGSMVYLEQYQGVTMCTECLKGAIYGKKA